MAPIKMRKTAGRGVGEHGPPWSGPIAQRCSEVCCRAGRLSSSGARITGKSPARARRARCRTRSPDGVLVWRMTSSKSQSPVRVAGEVGSGCGGCGSQNVGPSTDLLVGSPSSGKWGLSMDTTREGAGAPIRRDALCSSASLGGYRGVALGTCRSMNGSLTGGWGGNLRRMRHAKMVSGTLTSS